MKKLLKTLIAAFSLTLAIGAISACGGGSGENDSSIVNSSSEVSSVENTSENESSEEVSSVEESSEEEDEE